MRLNRFMSSRRSCDNIVIVWVSRSNLHAAPFKGVRGECEFKRTGFGVGWSWCDVRPTKGYKRLNNTGVLQLARPL